MLQPPRPKPIMLQAAYSQFRFVATEMTGRSTHAIELDPAYEGIRLSQG